VSLGLGHGQCWQLTASRSFEAVRMGQTLTPQRFSERQSLLSRSGMTAPVSRSRAHQRMALAALTPKSAAANRHDAPQSPLASPITPHVQTAHLPPG